VDVTALSAKKVALAIVGDVNSRTVAEHSMTLLLAASKRMMLYDAACRTPQGWPYRDSLEAREVYGKTLLIVGFGRIGRQLAAMARAFGMKITIFDPFVDRTTLDADIGVCDDLDQALAQSDAVSLHLPKIDGVLIGREQITRMKQGAVIVNAARGGLIDEEALAEALRAGKLQGAGLDVFGEEPPSEDHPLAHEDLAVLSPHIAGLTWECAQRMAVKSVENIINYFHASVERKLIVNADDIGL
ncbi:MAG: NAD(P)-dependent oxidoreductase, partial [Pseudomonadota bacterium]